jgi:hypothetical protein
MHAVGTSHNCDACIKADSLHDCRHRKVENFIDTNETLITDILQIAELVADYLALTEAETSSSKKYKKGSHAAPVPSTPTPLRERNLNAADRLTISTTGSTSSRLGNIDLEPLDLENIHIHEDTTSSSPTENSSILSLTPTSSTSPSNTTPNPKPTKAEQRANKRATKQAKSEQKSLKNQSKHPVVIKTSDVAKVHRFLHGNIGSDQSGNPTNHYAVAPALADDIDDDDTPSQTLPPSRHPLATDTAIEDVLQRNLAYVGHIKQHKAYLLRTVAGKKRTDRANKVHDNATKNVPIAFDENGVAIFEDAEAEDDTDALIDAILARFGIVDSSAGRHSTTATGTPNSKRALSSGGSSNQARNVLLAQLRVAIADDLKKHENEQRMTCIRAGSFWRYVGRQVFERMMRIGQERDWRTGVIRKEEKVEVVGETVEHDVGA